MNSNYHPFPSKPRHSSAQIRVDLHGVQGFSYCETTAAAKPQHLRSICVGSSGTCVVFWGAA
eukprot:532343-Rhodomonas_salina.1